MNISILGCGWLGLPLAKHLISNAHRVKGSTTTPQKLETLKAHDIQPYLVNLTPELQEPEEVQSFWDSDVLVLNIPPGRKRDNVIDFHTVQINAVIGAITDSPIKRVVFVSSTSVYPKHPGTVTEEDTIPGEAKRASGNALLQAESKLSESSPFDTTVIRFGGLIGYDRHPVKYLAGKKDLNRANAPVNLIHRDDCINIITHIIENNITGEFFNGVSDNHQTRKEYYTKAAKTAGMKPPEFREDSTDNYKIVSNERLKRILNYKFKNELL